MSWLFPAGIIAALALVAIVLLHMRHRLPEVIPFPQLAFWPRVPSETRESPRWRRPPLTLLFLLQLLATLLLVLAFMRPALPALDALGGQRAGAVHHVIVLDGSTSMLARGAEGVTGWDAARREAERALDGWQQGDGATVIVATAHPFARSAADSRQLGDLRDWLDRLTLPGGVPAPDAVARLLDDTRLPDLDRQVTLVTDGGLQLDGAGVETVVVGGDAPAGNVAIVASATTPLERGGTLVEATVLHDRPGTETIAWVARAAQQDIASGTVTLGSGASGAIEVRVPGGVERVTLEVISDDPLPADDRAVVLTGGGGLAGLRVVLVSDVPGPLQRALEVIPGATVETYPTTTPGISAIAASADLVVYEASAPATGDVPAVPMLFAQPAALEDAWQVVGVSPDPALAEVSTGDPVMRDIPLDGVRFGESPIYVLPESAQVVASGAEGDTSVPLIWRGTLADQPYVAWAFDAATSNITDRVAFPMLVAQVVATLAGAGSDTMLAPGDAVTLPVAAEATVVRVERPDGDAMTLTPTTAADGRPVVTVPLAAVPGVWSLGVEGAGGRELDSGTLVVNVGDASESRLREPAQVDIALAAGPDGEGATAATGDLLTEIWPLLVAAAIAIMVAEWWIWLGRSLPRRQVAGGTVA